MIQLREYQNKAVNDLRVRLSRDLKSLILRADTGAGKTFIFSYMVQKAVSKGKKVLIITDRLELLTQAGSSIEKFGIDVSLIDSNNNPDFLEDQVYVSMAQTLSRRTSKQNYQKYLFNVDLVIIDEAHKTIFDKFFEYFGEKTVVIGATATPIRVGNQPSLDKTYQDLVDVASVKELVDMEFLSPARSYAVPVDLSEVKMKGSEFDQGSMSDFYDSNDKYTGAVENYIKHANGTKSLLFCSGVKNSIAIRDQFREAGISAEHLDSENTSKKERIDILDRFDRGEFLVLCNVGILTTGYDCPSIQTIILYRATTSLALFLQMVGRGSRIYPGKDFFRVLDFGGNFKRFGLWESPREWSLLKKRKDKKSLGAMPIKECKQCEALVSAVAKECDYCGYVFPVIIKKTIQVLLEELEFDETQKDIDPYGYFRHLEKKAAIKSENFHWIVRQLRTPLQLSNFARYKKYDNPDFWSEGVLKRRQNYKR